MSDNSPNEDTEIAIGALSNLYDFIFYYKNTYDVGHDKNSFYVMQLPEADYVWLLGDSLLLKEGAIKNILGTIEKHEPGIISVNAVNRDLDKESRLYTDPNAVLNDLGWHITLTGSTIYSRAAFSVIDQFDPKCFKNFPQLALIFNFLSRDCAFFWDNNKWIESSPQKKGYWVNMMFSIFIDDWSTAIRNLPQTYSDEIKEKVIIEHSYRSNIFGFRALLKAKFLGVYNFAIFKKYKMALLCHSKLPSLILVFIALFPNVLLKMFFQIKEKKILAFKFMFRRKNC